VLAIDEDLSGAGDAASSSVMVLLFPWRGALWLNVADCSRREWANPCRAPRSPAWSGPVRPLQIERPHRPLALVKTSRRVRPRAAPASRADQQRAMDWSAAPPYDRAGRARLAAAHRGRVSAGRVQASLRWRPDAQVKSRVFHRALGPRRGRCGLSIERSHRADHCWLNRGARQGLPIPRRLHRRHHANGQPLPGNNNTITLE